MATLSRKSRKVYGKFVETAPGIGRFSYESPQDKEYLDAWLMQHVGHRVYVQAGIVSNDFSLPWLRFWYGVVVKTFADALMGGEYECSAEALSVFFPQVEDPESYRRIRKLFDFAPKEYVHEALKVFFPEQIDDESGLSVKKSFAKEGNIGETLIKQRLPYIERWASVEMGIVIPEIGEFLDENTGEIIQYDLSQEPYNLNKNKEKAQWEGSGVQNDSEIDP